MNIRWIVIFAEVAADGSFSRAAIRLNVAQPWLSAQVHKLEAETGVKLFERLNTGLELTPEGRDLLPYAQQIAASLRQFRDSARTKGDVRSKSLRIGSYLPMLEVEPLHRLNGNYAIQYSQYSTSVHTGPMDWLLESLNSGDLDMVAGIAPFPPSGDQRLELLELGPLHPLLLVPRPRAAAFAAQKVAGEVIATPQLASHPLLFEALLEPWRRAGAIIRPAPEADRGALEHFARMHGAAVLMVQGDAGNYAGDNDLGALPLDGVRASHVLIRVADRGLGRAAERYWTLATALSEGKSGIREAQP